VVGTGAFDSVAIVITLGFSVGEATTLLGGLSRTVLGSMECEELPVSQAWYVKFTVVLPDGGVPWKCMLKSNEPPRLRVDGFGCTTSGM
jgi:hypothetical protein